jgi:hypothetical protein
MQVPGEDQQVTRETFQFRVDKKKLQEAEWRDGHYLLRSNLTAGDPSVLWTRYVQLTQIESVFRSLKSELSIRPIRHQLEHRADAHILIAFLAYIDARLREIEDFVLSRLKDLNGLLAGETPRAKAQMAKHCTDITLTPEGKAYRLSGEWDLLGVVRSDGAGGQNRTGYARLFRAALYH